MTLLVDSSVLAYATGDPSHPLAIPARTFVLDVVEGRVKATTTPEVIQEYLHVHARRRPRPAAGSHGRDFIQMLAPLTLVDKSTIERATQEFEARPSIGSFDSVLVALALTVEELVLLTSDRAILAMDDVPTRDLASFS